MMIQNNKTHYDFETYQEICFELDAIAEHTKHLDSQSLKYLSQYLSISNLNKQGKHP